MGRRRIIRSSRSRGLKEAAERAEIGIREGKPIVSQISATNGDQLMHGMVRTVAG